MVLVTTSVRVAKTKTNRAIPGNMMGDMAAFIPKGLASFARLRT